MEASHAMIVTVTCVVLSLVSLAVYSEAVTRTGREQTAQALTLTGNLLERTHKLLLSPRTRRHALVSRWPRQFGRQAYHEKTRAVTKERVKRAPVSDSETKEYRSFHIDVSNCGTEKSCVRFGPPDCGMTECLYMLTFQKIGDVAEFELSAKTPGWVAVGFSSDNKMGGDEVISCIHNIVPYKISASTMMNVIPHEKPRPKPVPLNLTGSEYRNGFISCRVRRDMAAEGGMDLTNDWFQLYAWGNVGSTGGMMRHDWDKPPTSAQSYSIIQRNINDIRPVNGNAARHPVCVLLTAFCCFVKLMLV